MYRKHVILDTLLSSMQPTHSHTISRRTGV